MGEMAQGRGEDGFSLRSKGSPLAKTSVAGEGVVPLLVGGLDSLDHRGNKPYFLLLVPPVKRQTLWGLHTFIGV